MMGPLRVGILGFGFIGKVHAYAYRNMALYYDPPPIETRLVGVCTKRRETGEAARDLLGFDFATTDWREITENRDIDVVNICTPNSLHVEPLLSAIAHGKHVYCEKPLTASADEARRVVAALRDYRGTHQMTFNYRFVPATLRARQLVEAGFLGEPLCFRAAYLHSGSADPEAPLKWKLARDMGGGVIHDLGSHVLDLLRHLAGEFGEVSCAAKTAFASRPSIHDRTRRVPVDAEDHAVMLLRTCSGALGTVEASKIATGAEDEVRLEIHGTRGALRFNLRDPNWLEVYDATLSDQPLGGERGWKRLATVHRYPAPGGWPGPKFAAGWMRSHVACLYDFLCAIARGVKAEPGLETGARIQEIMAAAVESQRSRCWVSLEQK
jgi:predicted dehydrogenase